MLQDSGIDFHLTLAGDGPRGIQLKRLAGKLGVAGRVSFPGFVPYDHVSDLFRSADLFVMPSIVHSSGDRDGIPTVIMEALMHRVPVIATDVSGISEVIQNNVTGLLIPEKDPGAISKALETLISNREFAVGLAERGRELVREQFDPEKNHRLVSQLYMEYFGKQESA
jgi:glycosyltransferase involved in cell wall biosynthesis